jgi:ABC-type sugar transport system substrate-binding protein
MNRNLGLTVALLATAGCSSAASPTTAPAETRPPGYVTQAEYGDAWFATTSRSC